MPVTDYGLLVADQLVKIEADDPSKDNSPHIKLFLKDSSGWDDREWQCTINIKSAESHISEEKRRVIVYHNDQWQNDFIKKLEQAYKNGDLEQGWNAPTSEFCIDYLRQNVIDWGDMKIDEEIQPNNLIDYFNNLFDETHGDRNLLIFAFGSQFDDGSYGNRGVHEIHMNQGNDNQYSNSDGVNQDGALIMRYDNNGQTYWFAYFCAFQTQYYPTDNQTGHRMPDSQSVVNLIENAKKVAEVAPQSQTNAPDKGWYDFITCTCM